MIELLNMRLTARCTFAICSPRHKLVKIVVPRAMTVFLLLFKRRRVPQTRTMMFYNLWLTSKPTLRTFLQSSTTDATVKAHISDPNDKKEKEEVTGEDDQENDDSKSDDDKELNQGHGKPCTK